MAGIFRFRMEHEPCGMDGPESAYFAGWFSEIWMDEIITFEIVTK